MTHDVPDHEAPSRHVVTLDLDGIADRAGLMERCARALELPEWFGGNWDALADSLGDPTVWPGAAREGGLLVVVTGWRAYAATRPDEWTVAEDVFAQAADRAPEGLLTVALALGGSH
ncbi:barstar family protein [Streptomyces sp. NPDC002701]|uniref:barstar family protein n=1 Tax=Streptomyces sp. NPDC002701 TaxID=3364661 RepID=UPI0036A07BE4